MAVTKKELARERARQWYWSNLERVLEYRAANREKKKRENLEWRLRNKLRKKEYAAEWYQKNKDRVREQHILGRARRNELLKVRRETDINFRLAALLRTRLHHAISRGRKGSAVADLGCSIEDLRNHLESLFLPGMTWDNWGPAHSKNKNWNIDHIVPLTAFDLTDINQIKKACHYTNLRPMWAIDNIRKGGCRG